MPELTAAHVNRGIVLARVRQSGEAEAALRRALVVRPDNAQARSELGCVLAELGRLDEAKACHLKALDLDPNNPFFHLRLGDTHLLRRRSRRLRGRLPPCRVSRAALRPGMEPARAHP